MNWAIFIGMFTFYVGSCMYFHWRGFKVGFDAGRSLK